MLTILNKKALEQLNEQHLRMCDPLELRLIMDKVDLVNRNHNGGYMKDNRNLRFRGDMHPDLYWKMMRGLPKGDPERAKRKALFFKQFPKFSAESKSKYV